MNKETNRFMPGNSRVYFVAAEDVTIILDESAAAMNEKTKNIREFSDRINELKNQRIQRE